MSSVLDPPTHDAQVRAAAGRAIAAETQGDAHAPVPGPGRVAGPPVRAERRGPLALLATAITGVGIVLALLVLFELVVSPVVHSRSQQARAGLFADRVAVAQALASEDAGGGQFNAFGLGSSIDIDNPTVPKMAGETAAGATAKLEGNGYTVRRALEPSETVIPGMVVRTEPVAGSPIAPDTVITIVVATLGRGAPAAALRIPSLGTNQVVTEGSGAEDLVGGPGHLRSSPLPGEAGNSVILGHRTLYGAPFRRLGELRAGDEIVTTSLTGVFTYKVRETKVVRPGDPDVMGPTSENTLTLVTSHPEYASSERLAVIAALDGAPGPAFPRDASTPLVLTDDEFGRTSDAGAWAPLLLWGELFLGGLALTSWSYRRWRRWPTWLISMPLLSATGLLFCESVTRLFPSTV